MPAGPLIVLENAEQRLGLLPELGGSAAFWEVRRDENATPWCPIWRPYSADPARRVVANFPLLPWSNRLIGSGITVDGQFYPIRNNRPDEGMPMHGTGWMHPWEVTQHSATEVILSVEACQPCDYPFHYRARQLYRIEDHAMLMRLELTHLGAQRMPYGLGFHPYILRAPDLRLRFGASAHWPAKNRLPVEDPSEIPPEWDFNQLREIGSGLIDHNFRGCDGRMTMERPDIDLHLDWHTTAPQDLDTAILFRPAHDEWFCYEPVTHITGAHARPGMPGLRLLEQGESMTLEVRQTLSRLTT